MMTKFEEKRVAVSAVNFVVLEVRMLSFETGSSHCDYLTLFNLVVDWTVEGSNKITPSFVKNNNRLEKDSDQADQISTIQNFP